MLTSVVRGARAVAEGVQSTAALIADVRWTAIALALGHICQLLSYPLLSNLSILLWRNIPRIRHTCGEGATGIHASMSSVLLRLGIGLQNVHLRAEGPPHCLHGCRCECVKESVQIRTCEFKLLVTGNERVYACVCADIIFARVCDYDLVSHVYLCIAVIGSIFGAAGILGHTHEIQGSVESAVRENWSGCMRKPWRYFHKSQRLQQCLSSMFDNM